MYRPGLLDVMRKRCADKHKYINKATAEGVIVELKNRKKKGKDKKNANRAYICPECRFWHITSKVDRFKKTSKKAGQEK